MPVAPSFQHGSFLEPDASAQVVSRYLRHVEAGVPIRQLAREAGCHPSTVHRQIRKIEARRDDILIDTALSDLARKTENKPTDKGKTAMQAMRHNENRDDLADPYQKEALRILRRLAEPGACLAYAKDMEKAVVVRESADGGTVRTAVTDREIAQKMAIEDWLVCRHPGRVSRYHMTSAGRSAMKRMLAEQAGQPGFHEASTPFGHQHREWADRPVTVDGTTRVRQMRFNAAESPISLLARRKDASGDPFLSPGQVAAAERLREDFELSQIGPRVTQNWEKFLTGGSRGALAAGPGAGGGSDAARRRVAEALAELGPGLGDIALRVCCFVEGVETAEKRLGWAARSGKIVLRIALIRLERHYQAQGGTPMIG